MVRCTRHGRHQAVIKTALHSIACHDAHMCWCLAAHPLTHVHTQGPCTQQHQPPVEPVPSACYPTCYQDKLLPSNAPPIPSARTLPSACIPFPNPATQTGTHHTWQPQQPQGWVMALTCRLLADRSTLLQRPTQRLSGTPQRPDTKTAVLATYAAPTSGPSRPHPHFKWEFTHSLLALITDPHLPA